MGVKIDQTKVARFNTRFVWTFLTSLLLGFIWARAKSDLLAIPFFLAIFVCLGTIIYYGWVKRVIGAPNRESLYGGPGVYGAKAVLLSFYYIFIIALMAVIVSTFARGK